jgi:hypothetical protein
MSGKVFKRKLSVLATEHGLSVESRGTGITWALLLRILLLG